MALKKSELYSSLWSSCDELRGGMDASQYKDYVLVLLFIKYVSDKYADLFYGTGIPACIIVIDKLHAATRYDGGNGIFMLDASAGYIKDGPKNRLRSQDIHRIVDVFTRRLDVPGYARTVGITEIEANGFNLNLPRYIDNQQAEDRLDIAGHLQGGIPEADVDALSRYWTVCPQLRASLFRAKRPGDVDLAVELATIKTAEAKLDADVYAHYPTLSEDQVQSLVVDDKWLAILAIAIHGELDRVSQQLTQRVKELAERYQTPMAELTERVTEREARVKRHLERMGFAP